MIDNFKTFLFTLFRLSYLDLISLTFWSLYCNKTIFPFTKIYKDGFTYVEHRLVFCMSICFPLGY